jgi:hypothetical protein
MIINPLLTNITSKSLLVVLSKQLHILECSDCASISNCHKEMAACGYLVVISVNKYILYYINIHQREHENKIMLQQQGLVAI